MYDELIKRLRSEAIYLPEKFSKNAELLDVLMKAADAIEDLIAALTASNEVIAKNKPRWIPVTERLPRDRQLVLVYCGDNKRIRPSDRFDVAILLGDSIFTSLGVTHWMPLPQPPKEE